MWVVLQTIIIEENYVQLFYNVPKATNIIVACGMHSERSNDALITVLFAGFVVSLFVFAENYLLFQLYGTAENIFSLE